MLTNEQKLQRVGKITSSTSAAVLGLSPYMTPTEAWLAIMGRSHFRGNEATARGDALEEAVIKWGAKRIGAEYSPSGTVLGAWTADNCDGFYHHEDGVISVVEAKTRSAAMEHHYGKEGTDDVYTGDVVQSLFHLWHRPGCPRCTLPVLIGGYEFNLKMYVVHRCEDVMSEMMQRLEHWWEKHVVADSPPPPVGGDIRWLGEKACRSLEKVVRSGDDRTDELVRKYVEFKKLESRYKKEKDDVRALLADSIGPNAELRGVGYSAKWVTRHTKGKIDWKAAARAAGVTDDEAEKFYQEGSKSTTLMVYIRKT